MGVMAGTERERERKGENENAYVVGRTASFGLDWSFLF